MTKLNAGYPRARQPTGLKTNRLHAQGPVTVKDASIHYSRHLDPINTCYPQQKGRDMVVGGR
jgi:hypothetical protein